MSTPAHHFPEVPLMFEVPAYVTLPADPESLAHLPIRTVYPSRNLGGDLMVVALHGISPEGGAAEVTATSDGRRVEHSWHVGPESGEVAYFETERAGRRSHGYVDLVSRQIVQVG